jgi:hypothetical protein
MSPDVDQIDYRFHSDIVASSEDNRFILLQVDVLIRFLFATTDKSASGLHAPALDPVLWKNYAD